MAHDISLDGYELLCSYARELNEYVPPERLKAAYSAASDAQGSRPGDEFNRRANWEDILAGHGWRVDRVVGEVTYWTRPGKGRGVSASTGFCKGDTTGDLLYVWSSNADPFEPGHAYDKFGALTTLEHHGDFSAAAKWLAANGYAPPTSTISFPEPEVTEDTDDVAGIDDLKKAGAEIKWVWPKWIQRGVVTAIAAQGGTGKTRLMADLVRRVRHHLPWPDLCEMNIHPAKKTVALWVVADNHHDEMVTLCDSFGISDCVRLNASKADPYGGVTLDLLEDFEALERRVKTVQPVFVVVDTVGNATDRNLSRQEDAKAFYQPLQILARRQNVAVMALTHLNANGKILGRRALEKVRTCLRMNAADTSGEAKRRLEVTKSNSLRPEALGVQMHDDRNDYDNDPPPPPEDANNGDPVPKVNSKNQQCLQWLEAMIREKPYRVAELRKLGENAGFSAKELYRCKEQLKITEKEIQGYKWWVLSDVIRNSD
jgi:hypothetical protein